MKLDVTSLKTAGEIGVAFFFIRIVGKYLGLALIPQAGVSIGLAFLAKRMLPTELGTMLVTIILSSSVLYELIGPACAKFAIFKTSIITPLQTQNDIPNDNNIQIENINQ